MARNDAPDRVPVGSGDGLAVHLVRNKDVAEGVDGLVEREGAAVLVADLVEGPWEDGRNDAPLGNAIFVASSTTPREGLQAMLPRLVE